MQQVALGLWGLHSALSSSARGGAFRELVLLTVKGFLLTLQIQVSTLQLHDCFLCQVKHHLALQKQEELSNRFKASNVANFKGNYWLSQLLWSEQGEV